MSSILSFLSPVCSDFRIHEKRVLCLTLNSGGSVFGSATVGGSPLPAVLLSSQLGVFPAASALGQEIQSSFVFQNISFLLLSPNLAYETGFDPRNFQFFSLSFLTSPIKIPRRHFILR